MDAEIEVRESPIKLPKSVIASVRRARTSAVSRRDTLTRKIEEFDHLLEQYGETADSQAAVEAEAAGQAADAEPKVEEPPEEAGPEIQKRRRRREAE